MATGIQIQDPVFDVLRREEESEKNIDQDSYIILGKLPLQENIRVSHTPNGPQDTFETNFEVKDLVEGNQDSASIIEGENFLKTPSAAGVHFEENIAPDFCEVTENAEKVATRHDNNVSHHRVRNFDAEESNVSEKGMVSEPEDASTSGVGHDEPTAVHKSGLSENKDGESIILEKVAHMEALNITPEDIKPCVTDATETPSIGEKILTSTPRVISGDKIKQTRFDTNEETPQNASTAVQDDDIEQNSRAEVDNSQKIEERLEKEYEKLESTLVPEAKLKDEESRQNELSENKNENDNHVETLPVASKAGDIKIYASDHETGTNAPDNQILTENPQEIEGDETETKSKERTLEEQEVSKLVTVIGEESQTKHEAHLEKESEKPCSSDASMRDINYVETTPMDNAKTENEELTKSDLPESKENTENAFLVEAPIIEKHLKSNATPDGMKDVPVQDTETKNSIKEKVLTVIPPKEIRYDETEKTAFDTRDETPEDISTVMLNETTGQNSTFEVPLVTEALSMDNELTIGKENIEDNIVREENLFENQNDGESELMDGEVKKKPVKSLLLASEAEDTKIPTLHHEIAVENQIQTENPQEIVGNETESLICDVVDTKEETLDVPEVSKIVSNDDNEESRLKNKNENEKRVEILPVASEAEDIKASTSDQERGTSALRDQFPTENPQQSEGDEIESKSKKRTLEEQVQDVPKLVSVIVEDDSQTKHEAHLEKESEKPCSSDASMRDINYVEMTPMDNAKTENEELTKSDLPESKEDTENAFLVGAPIIEKHLELNATPEDMKACVSVQDIETNSSIKEKILTEIPQEIRYDKIEQTTFDTRGETPEDISTVVPNEETEQNSSLEVPVVTEALTMDNEPVIAGENIKENDLREENSYENKKYSESESMNGEVKENFVESLQLAFEAEDTKVSSLHHDVALEDQIEIENPQEIVGDETESKICDVVDTKEETPDVKSVAVVVPNDVNVKNPVIGDEDSRRKYEEHLGEKSGHPLFREESTRDATSDESTHTQDNEIEDRDHRRAEFIENSSGAEISPPLIEEATATKLVESPSLDTEDIKTYVSGQGVETTGQMETFEGDGNRDQSVTKYEVKTEDDSEKENEVCDSEKNPECTVLLEAAQIEKPIQTLQETLPRAVPWELVDDKTEEKIIESIEKTVEALDVQNVTTVPDEKIEKNSPIQVDDSPVQHEEYVEKESEIPSMLEAPTKHAHDNESITIHENNTEHENQGKVELLECKKNVEINSPKDEEQTETPIVSLPVAAEDIMTSDSYQGTETTTSREENILNENETVCKQTEVETIGTAGKNKETPEAQKVSAIVSDNVDDENLLAGVYDSHMKSEEELGKESGKLCFIETSTRDVSGDESTNNHEAKKDWEDQARAELFEDKKDTETMLLKEEETVLQPVKPQEIDAEDIKKHISYQGTAITGQIDIFEGDANDGKPEVKRKTKTEDGHQKEDVLSDIEKIRTSPLEVAQMEKPFQSLRDALPAIVPQSFLYDETKETTIDETEKDEKIHEKQNIKSVVSNENIEDESLLQVDDSQIQSHEYSDAEREITSITEASRKNVNGGDPVNVHKDSVEREDLIKNDLVESERDTKIASQKEEAVMEMPVHSFLIAAEDILASDSCREIETPSSQEERIIDEEEIMREQIEVKKLDTADKRKETPKVQDVPTIVSNDNNEENQVIGDDDSPIKYEERLGEESEKPSFEDKLTRDAASNEPKYKHEDQIEAKDRKKAELFDNSNNTESLTKLVESSPVDAEDIKTYVSGQVAETLCITEAFEVKTEDEGDTKSDQSSVKHEVKTEDDNQKEEFCDNEKNPGSRVLLEAARIEKPIEPLQETLPSATPSGFQDDKTEETTTDAIDEKILDVQNVTTVSNEKIEENSSIQVDDLPIPNEKYLEKGSKTPCKIEASMEHSNDNESITIHEDNIKLEDLRKAELLESKKDREINSYSDEEQIETSINFLQVAAQDILSSNPCQEMETESPPEKKILNESEIMHKQIGTGTLDTVVTKKETPEAQNFATFLSDENIKENSHILEDESEQKEEEVLEKECKTPSSSETLISEAQNEVPTIILQDKIEDEKLGKVDKLKRDKLEEIALLNQEPPVEELNELLKKDLFEDIKDFVSSEDTTEKNLVEMQSLNENPLKIVHNHVQENTADKDPEIQDLITVDTSQTKHEELLEKESRAPSSSLINSSVEESAIVHMRKIEDKVPKIADKFECVESGKVALLKEASTEKLTEASKDLDRIKESPTCIDTEISSSAEEQNLTAVSRKTIDDQLEDKELNKAREASDFTTINPNRNTDKSLSVQVDASQKKQEEQLEKISQMPSLLILNTSMEEPTVVHENKIMENKFLSNEEKVENFSKEENEDIKPPASSEDTEITSGEQKSLIENPHDIVCDPITDRIIVIAQNAWDLTTISSDKNIEENTLIELEGQRIECGEPLEKIRETPSLLRLHTTEESTLLQEDTLDDVKVGKLECEKHAKTTLRNEQALVEKVNESPKEEPGDSKVSLSFDDQETSSIDETSRKANPLETVVDRTHENILESATKASAIEHNISHENARENLLSQFDEPQVKPEIMGDQTQENALDTDPEEGIFKPAISHENTEEKSLIQVDESQMKQAGILVKESGIPYLVIVDTSNEESRIMYEGITDDENLEKVDHFECEKREAITSTKEEAEVKKLNESLKEDVEDIKVLVTGEDTGTSFTEKQSVKEYPQEILSDQQREKILDIAPEPQDLIKVVPSENVEKDSSIQEDGSQIMHKKEGETPTELNAAKEDSMVLHGNKIENEDPKKVEMFECEKDVADKILDASPEALEFKINVLDGSIEEKSLNKVDKSQVKHEELFAKERKTVCFSETSLSNISSEESTNIKEDKIVDKDPDKIDKLECEKHTEFPLIKEVAPVQKLKKPSREDLGESKISVSCVETETGYMEENQSLKTIRQAVERDNIEENIIYTTPEAKNLISFVSDENTKENLLMAVDASKIKHETLENDSEKPSLSMLKSRTEEPSGIPDSDAEDEYVKKDSKQGYVEDVEITMSNEESSVENLNDFTKIEGHENIKASVSIEDIETESPVEERGIKANPEEDLTKDKTLDTVPEEPETKTVLSDKNLEENLLILEVGPRARHEELFEEESEAPSFPEMLNTHKEEQKLILDDKIENGYQSNVAQSECEKHLEIMEKEPGENTNVSNLENIEAFVSGEDIETTKSSEEPRPTVYPIENVGGEEVEKILDTALESSDLTTVQDENAIDDPLIQVDGSQMKHEEPLEKESKAPSLLEIALLDTKNEEVTTIYKDQIADADHKNVDELESEKFAEIDKLKEEAQVEDSTELMTVVDKDIEAYASYQDIEESSLNKQMLTANSEENLGNQTEKKTFHIADSNEKITETLTVSNETIVQDSLNQIYESEIKHEYILEKESEIPYLIKISMGEGGNKKESNSVHENMIEEGSGKTVEFRPLNEESSTYESVEALQVASEDIKPSVSCQDRAKSSILNANPQEIVGDQTTLEPSNSRTLVSDEKEALDSISSKDGLEIKHGEILETDCHTPLLTNTSMEANNEELMIIHEDVVEGENLKKVDTFDSGEQIATTLLKEEERVYESIESLQVAFEHIKASVSCQDTEPTNSSEEQLLTTTAKENVGDKEEVKAAITAKTWEITPEVTSCILVFKEDEAKVTPDDQNGIMAKDEETSNKHTASNAPENDEICASDKVQEKEEEKEMISERKSDEEMDKADNWIGLAEDKAGKTHVDVEKIDISSHVEDTSQSGQYNGSKDIPQGNRSAAKIESFEEGYSNKSTESTASIVTKVVEQINKDIKAEAVTIETGTASSASPITVQCGQEENESEESKETEKETSLEHERQGNQGQLTKLDMSPLLSHVKDSDQEMATKRGIDNLQSGCDMTDEMQELEKGSVAASIKRNFLEANSNDNTEINVSTGVNEADGIQQEDVPEEKGMKSGEGEIKFDDSDDLKLISSNAETETVTHSGVLCSSTSDAGQRGTVQTVAELEIEEQKLGKEKNNEADPEENGINVEEDEIKEDYLDALKENSSMATPVDILQDSTIDAAQRVISEEIPEQHVSACTSPAIKVLDTEIVEKGITLHFTGPGETDLKENEARHASTTDNLIELKAYEVNNAYFESSVGSNKILVLLQRDSSEISQIEGEKDKTSKLEKGGNEETAEPTESSEPTKVNKPTLSGLLQETAKEVSKIAYHSTDEKEPTIQKEELQAEKSNEAEHVQVEPVQEKDGREETHEHQISDLSADAPVMVDAGDRYVKVVHKKSNNILFGVGSKVKRSIYKVKKAITGKSSHSKSASSKYGEKI